VLDSVVGVLLTQNVSDALSSKAWMTLAATFPLQVDYWPCLIALCFCYRSVPLLSRVPQDALAPCKWSTDHFHALLPDRPQMMMHSLINK
jgi:hypothetical protein